MAKLKEKLRLKRSDIESSFFYDLMSLCSGMGMIGHPNIRRIDDPKTGDIIFYEKEN